MSDPARRRSRDHVISGVLTLNGVDEVRIREIGRTKTAPAGWAWARWAEGIVTVLAGAAAVFLAYFAVRMVIPPAIVGADFDGYRAAGQRFLGTGSPYAPVQLLGPYDPWSLPQAGVFLHPPTALLLVLPFLVLPAVLWWALPLAAIGWVLWTYRPAAWGWAVILLFAAWPRTVGAVLLGNSDLWVAAGVALGLRFGWPAVAVFLKPSLAPLALIGANRRAWWVATAAFALISLTMLPLWSEWWATIRNGSGLGLTYSLASLPLPAISLVAWASARSH